MSPRPPRAHAPALALNALEDRLNPGGGTFDQTTGTFNFSVAVRYDATDAELQAIRLAFQIGSDVIADATDGQHRFGTVTIVNNSGESAEAEFYILKVAAQANGTPDAPRGGGGYGVRGLHANMYQYTADGQYGTQLYGGTALDANNANGAGYTIAHEFAHLAYGILDEYSGPTGRVNVENAPAAAESATLNFSLMDNFFTRGGRGAPFTLNEFSVATNHDPDNDTHQTAVNRRNDWAQVATRYPVRIPTGLPVDAAPNTTTRTPEGKLSFSAPVTFRDSSTNAPFTVLVLENSGEVLTSDLRGFIQTGSALYVETAGRDESVGVFHYASGVNITSPIRPMTDANRTAAIAAINALPVSTDPVVEPSVAVNLAIGQIASRAASPNRVIVLVGSGVRTATQNVLDQIPVLNQNNISVIAVLANPNPSGADVDTFRLLAEGTGGTFIHVDETSDFTEVVGIFSTFRQGNGLLTQAPPSDLAAGGTVSQTVAVEPGTAEVILGAAALTPGAGFAVTLQSPSGQVISAAGPGVEPLPLGPILGFRVTNPEPGVWTVLSAAGPSDVGPVGVVGLRPNDPYRVVVHADTVGVTFPAPIPVRVVPMFQGRAVVGATVSGVATGPTGARVPVFFFDDGLPAHGDTEAGDGTYSALFNGYSDNGNGAYTFSAVANGFGTTAFGGEALPGGGEPVPEPVPDFTRAGTGTAVVTGVPATVVANDLSVLLSPGAPGSFVVTVLNGGSAPATRVRASVFLGSGVRLTGGTATQGTFAAADGTMTFDVGTVDVGGSASLTLSVAALRSGTVNVIAEVASLNQTDPLLENNEAVLPLPLVRAERIAVGSDRGGGVFLAIDPRTGVQTTVAPFGAGFTGGVRTAAADFNGDGVPDLVAGTGPGRATRVVVLDGTTQQELFAVDPFEAAFTGGVYVAAGDVNGDDRADLVITPDEGGGPRARVFSGNGFAQLADFFGISDPNFRGGARAALGDVTGDGVADLIVAAGFGGGPRVAVFDGSKLAAEGALADQTTARWESWKPFGDFLTFEESLRNGSFVAAGDVDGDGFAELIAGGGPGGGPRVSVFDGKDLVTANGKQTRDADFFAGDTNNRGGVRLAAKDFDGDDRADVVTGSGTGAGSRVTVYAGAALGGDPPPLYGIDAFAGFAGGVFVG